MRTLGIFGILNKGVGLGFSSVSSTLRSSSFSCIPRSSHLGDYRPNAIGFQLTKVAI
jgi:hypothetical protein